MQLRGILGNLTQLNATICNLVKVNAIYGCWVLNRIKSPTTRRQDVCCTGADFVHPLPTPPPVFACGSMGLLLCEAYLLCRDSKAEWKQHRTEARSTAPPRASPHKGLNVSRRACGHPATRRSNRAFCRPTCWPLA